MYSVPWLILAWALLWKLPVNILNKELVIELLPLPILVWGKGMKDSVKVYSTFIIIEYSLKQLSKTFYFPVMHLEHIRLKTFPVKEHVAIKASGMKILINEDCKHKIANLIKLIWGIFFWANRVIVKKPQHLRVFWHHRKNNFSFPC